MAIVFVITKILKSKTTVKKLQLVVKSLKVKFINLITEENKLRTLYFHCEFIFEVFNELCLKKTLNNNRLSINRNVSLL